MICADSVFETMLPGDTADLLEDMVYLVVLRNCGVTRGEIVRKIISVERLKWRHHLPPDAIFGRNNLPMMDGLRQEVDATLRHLQDARWVHFSGGRFYCADAIDPLANAVLEAFQDSQVTVHDIKKALIALQRLGVAVVPSLAGVEP